MVAPSPVPVVLVGAHGHGEWHLRNVDRLTRAGVPVRLAGICDPRPLDAAQRTLAGDVPVSARLDDLLDAVRPQVTVVSTPIHTHAELALAAASAGSAVLLEKPPTPTLAAFEQLLAGLAATGRPCQVGFQSLGSQALPAVRDLLADGAVGEVLGIGAAGAWQRDASYYARAPWAGRRSLDGVPVVDGALTNPFAHAIATALALDGGAGEQGVDDVRVELFRANPIEADDTSSLRLVTARGTTVTVAVTLAADEVVEPHLVVHGTRGRVVLSYRSGQVRLERDGRSEVREHGATDLLENLAAHVRDPAVPLLVPLAGTRAFMQVVEAVRLAADPVAIAPPHSRVTATGATARHVVPGSAAAVVRSADRLALLSELDLPWARPAVAARG
ncbi:Predicted dehydrogenase [Geodermatophilus saharensis]|uniref:Predicted dehydrogenase n=1 Tax=Geodermatophilus saharensis TaxID=1137994 RepID=A0A239D0M7_9ACTN|nr:Gfo/Idh/MocA family oxidoreductase [Geodermatophilus saharensis]SNS26066.1 Predicted dehydrogenase [Geodermatophilus saharensis]